MKKLLLLAICCMPLAAAAMNPAGTPVKRIVFANQIDGWHAIDQQRLILSTSPSRHYLVTLDRRAAALPFAFNVGVSTSNNAIYSGFDYIYVDGIRFGIDSIMQIDRDQMRALTKA